MKSILAALILTASSSLSRHSATADQMFHSRAGRVAHTSLAGFISTQPPTTHFRRATTPAFGTRSLLLAPNPQDSTVAVVDEMPPTLPPLKNYYYLLRHGQSTANVEGIISSARSLAGSTKHGLTLLGIQQGKDSASALVDMVADDMKNDRDDNVPKSTKQLFFYSSPFARAKETAEACLRGVAGDEEVAEKVKALGLEVNGDISLDDGLMERYFGRLDGKELSTYGWVWPVDMVEPTNIAFDVESVAAVSTRIRATLLNIDSQHTDGGNHIVLTSHADVLQITQVYAAGLDNVGMFSQYRFGNGEVRKMGRVV
eukprot:CAMPEP_0172313628 /NCGR_PEP_ID=MMETSP1058-20130122/20649_1 /TAXON_ID=83371 /ORGANISM="Detonula confervacea, Strain CCMP 353" /LENGTH=313 /DNA_ID=CAMNT_0013027311 /DNA_START=19 /DNA_END=956 /DNA_ORIENTATION=-